MNINGVEVDFIGEYEYPYFLKKYKGYAIKIVNRVGVRELISCNLIVSEGYLPIFIVNVDYGLGVRSVTEKEKNGFSFDCSKLEIERSIFSIDNFNGVLIFHTEKDNYVCGNSIVVGDNKVILKGMSGTLRQVLENTLLIYNRRIV